MALRVDAVTTWHHRRSFPLRYFLKCEHEKHKEDGSVRRWKKTYFQLDILKSDIRNVFVFPVMRYALAPAMFALMAVFWEKGLAVPMVTAAIALDSANAGATNASASTSLSWSHTCTGSNLGLIVGIGYREVSGTRSATYNGVAMTSVVVDGTKDTNSVTEIFKLIAPSTGANNVVLTKENDISTGGSISFSGADQTALTGDTDKQVHTVTSETLLSLDTTRANSFLVAMEWLGVNLALTQSNGQTEVFDRVFSTSNRRGALVYKQATTVGNYPMGYSWDGTLRASRPCAVEILESIAVSAAPQTLALMGVGS